MGFFLSFLLEVSHSVRTLFCPFVLDTCSLLVDYFRGYSSIPLKSVTVARTSIVIFYHMRVRWRRWRGNVQPMAFESFTCFARLPWLICPLTFTTSDFTSAQRLQSSHGIDWLTRCGWADVSICYHWCCWVTAGLHSLTSNVCGTPKSSSVITWSMIWFCK